MQKVQAADLSSVKHLRSSGILQGRISLRGKFRSSFLLFAFFLSYLTLAVPAWAGWIDQTVDSPASTVTGWYSSIVVDSNNNPHIAYRRSGGSAGSLYIADYSGSSWTATQLDSLRGDYCNMVMDSVTVRYYVSYEDASPKRLYFILKKPNGTWGTAVQAQSGNLSNENQTAIAISSGGSTVHIVYADGGLKYELSTDTGTTWASASTIDSGANAGLYPAIYAASYTAVHVSYYDSTALALKYAFFNGTAWTLVTVDSSATVGLYTSIAVDTNSKVYISYYDQTNGNLKYVYRSSTGGWFPSTVDSLGDVGKYTSIKLVNGLPQIAYYDVTNTHLKLAKYDGSVWTTETADSVGNVGQYASLAFDTSGQANISSFYSVSSNLGYLRYEKRGAIKPDALVKNSADSSYTGDGIYNTDGTNQTVGNSAQPQATVIYNFQIQNDGATGDVTLTGTAGDSQWTVNYFNALTGGSNITSNMTGSGYVISSLAQGGSTYIRAEVTPGNSAAVNSVKNILVTAASADNSDVAKASTTVTTLSQPDAKIKNSGDTDYTGSGIYNQDGSFQNKTQTVLTKSTAVFNICVRNDGNGSETFIATAPTIPAGWTVNFFDDLTTGTNITSSMTGTGWTSPVLAAGASTFLRLEVSPSSGSFGGGTKNDILFNVRSASSPSKQDNILLRTQVKHFHRPDGQIKYSTDTAYLGDDIYNTDASSQTRSFVAGFGQTVVYKMLLQNDGNSHEAFRINGSSRPGWTTVYYDIEKNQDISKRVYGRSGWTRGDFPSGTTREIRIEITPGSSLTSADTYYLPITVLSVSSKTMTDTVAIYTTAGSSYKPDAGIKLSTESVYAGDNFYNLTGANQTKNIATQYGSTAVYHLNFQNDGNVADTFVITGTAGDGNWAIDYYDALTNGTKITSQVTGAGYTTASLAAGASVSIRLEVSPKSNLAGGSFKTVFATATSNGNGAKQDVVKAQTSILNALQPDAWVKNGADDASLYIGNDIYSSTASGQVKGQVTANQSTVTYNIQIQNDGNSTSSFTVTASSYSGNWWVNFYDHYSTGTNISAQIFAAAGWTTPLIAAGSSVTIRLEVAPNGLAAGTTQVVFCLVSAINGPGQSDAVKMVTGVREQSRPDLSVKKPSDAAYLGSGVANSDGTDQTASSSTLPNTAAIYQIQLNNFGNATDTYTLTSSSSSTTGWTVKYYNALANGTDITSIVFSTGFIVPALSTGSSYSLRAEVTPGASIPTASVHTLFTTAVSSADNTKTDTIKMQTTVSTLRKPDLMVQLSTETVYVGNDIYNGTGASQTKMQSVDPTNTVIYNVLLANDGNDSDIFIVTGTVASTGWTVSYFDALSGGNNITALINGVGYSTGIAQGASTYIRVEVTPDTSTLAGAGLGVNLTAYSQYDTTALDVTIATTNVNAYYQPDGQIEAPGDTEFTGVDFYTNDGSDEWVAQNASSDNGATYYIQARNDGNGSDSFVVTGSTGTNANGFIGWTITYYDAQFGGSDISAQVRGAGWTSASTTIGSSVTIRAVVVPSTNVAIEDEFISSVTIKSQAQPANLDLVAMVADAVRSFQPDVSVRLSTETAFTGGGIYNLTAASQTVQGSSKPLVNQLYNFALLNASPVNDIFVVTGPATSTGWTLAYYNAFTGGTEITSQMTGAGFTTGNLSPGATQQIRLEVTPDYAYDSGSATLIQITVRSSGNSNKVDVAAASAAVTNGYRPDILVKTSSQSTYTGGGVYNTNASGQTVERDLTTNNTTSTFLIVLKNSGNASDAIKLTGDPAAAGWIVAYFSSGATTGSGGLNITSSVTGSGYITASLTKNSTVTIRCDVYAGTTTGNGDTLSLNLTLASNSDGSATDAGVITTKVNLDTTAPSAVTSLTATSPSVGQVQLNWTSPGDDGSINDIVGGYIRIQYSTNSNTSWNVNNFTVEIPTSDPALSQITYLVTGLTEGGTYYFVEWTGDEIPNWANVSNVATGYVAVSPPNNITDLVVSAGPADGKVQLSWTAPGNDGTIGSISSGRYRIRYSTTSFLFFSSSYTDLSGSSSTIALGDINIDTATVPGTAVGTVVTGLNPGTSYYFGIITRDPALVWSSFTIALGANSLSSGPVTDLPLAAPTALSALAVDVTQSSMTLRWVLPAAPASVDDRSQYRLYTATASFSSVSDSWVYLSSTVAHPLTTAATVQMNSNTVYYFAVTAVDSGTSPSGLYSIALESPISNIFSTATLAAAPGSSSFTSVQATSVTISWTANGNQLTPPTSYQVQISTDINFGVFTTSNTFNLSATGISLIPNTSYYFRVAAYNRTGGQSAFNTAIATFTQAVSPGIDSFQMFNTSLSVTLASNGNPPGTTIAITTGSFGVAESSVGVQDTGNTTLVITNLTPNTTYTILTRAINYTNLPSTVTTVASTSTFANVPGVITITSVDIATVSISWLANNNPLTPPTSYQVQVSTDINFGVFTDSRTFVLNASSYSLFANTSYYFRVLAYHRGGGQSAFNTAVATYTLANVPGNSGFQVFNTSINVILGPNGNPPGTTIAITTGSFGVAESSVGAQGIANSTLTLLNLTPNTTYTIKARAVNFNNIPTNASTIATDTITLVNIPGANSFIGVSGTSITLTWAANGNPLTPPTSYQMQISTWNGFAGTVTSSETFRIQASTSGLIANVTYYFRVRAYGRGGDSSGYNAVISTVVLASPNSPAPIAFQIFATSINVILDANGNPAGTTFWITTGTFKVSDSSSGPSNVGYTTFTMTNLIPNTTYIIQTQAFGASASSSTQVASTNTLAAVPTLTEFQVFTTSVTITLGANGNPIGTPLMVSTGTAGFFGVTNSSVGVVTGSTTTLIISNLTPNTFYGLQGGARDTSPSASTQTMVVTVTTNTLAAVPGNFNALTSTGVAISSLTVSWNNNNNPLTPPTSYQVQVSTDINFGVFTTSDTFLTSMSTTGMIANTSYYFKVSAYNRSGGQSAFNSSIATFTRVYSPGIVGFQIFNTSANVFISANGNPAGTTISVTTGAFAVTESSVGAESVGNTTFTLLNLNPNTAYTIQMRAVNYVNLPSSATTVATATPTLVNMPGVNSFIGVSGTSITVTWLTNGNPLNPPTSYQMQISTWNGFAGTVTSSETFLVQASSSGLSPNTTYYFRVRAYGRSGDTSSYNTVISTIVNATPNSPAPIAFQIFATSINVILDANGNPAGTTFAISTGAFAVTNSSSGPSNVGYTTFTMTNLIPNTTYVIQTHAVNFFSLVSSATQVASTTTLAAVPAVAGFQIFTTSVSIMLGANGNPVGTPLMVSTGTAGFFGVANSSVGVVTGSTTTLIISNLTPNTFYGLQGGARDTSPSASTQTMIVTAATNTLAAVPGNFNALTSTGVAISSLTVSWNNNNNPLTPPTSYQVQVSTDVNFGIFTASDTFLTNLSTTGMIANTSYYFKVSAYNRTGGQSGFNTSIATFTLAASPAAVNYIVNRTSITVTLASNGNPAGTTIAITTGAFAVTESSIGVQANGNTTLVISNLIPNTSYTVKTQAVSFANLASSVTTVASTTTLTAGVTITGFNVYVTSVAITIGANGNPNGTQIVVSTGTNGHFAVALSSVGKISGTNTTLVITGLSTNTAYGFQGGGLDGTGSTVPATVTASTWTLSVPPALSSFVMVETSATVSLGLNTNPAGTTLEISTNDFAAGSSSAGIVTTLAFSNLIANTPYTIKARSQNGTGAKSDPIVIASTATFPAAPGAVTFTTVGDSTITLTWGANGNPLTPPTSYQVQISSNDPNFAGVTSSSVTFLTSASTYALSINTTYYFKVRAYGVGGAISSYTAAIATFTKASGSPTIPSTPTALTIIEISTGHVTYSWTDNSSNEDGFKILSSTLGLLGQVAANITQFSVTNLTPNYLSVVGGIEAFNSGGSSTYTATVSTYTWARSPDSPKVTSSDLTGINIAWGSNGNPNTVAYEVSQSTDNFAFSAGISTPVPFASVNKSTSAVIHSVVPGVNYWFRIRALNSANIATAFSASITTGNPAQKIVTCESITSEAGGTTVNIAPCVAIAQTVLPNGSTEQVIVATQPTQITYGNGIQADLPPGLTLITIPHKFGVEFQSTQTITATCGGVIVYPDPGKVMIECYPDSFFVNMTSGMTTSPSINASVLPTSTKTVEFTLNPLPGIMKLSIPPGSFCGQEARLRVKAAENLPKETESASGETVNGTGIGLEINLDKGCQPQNRALMTMSYSSSQEAKFDVNTFVIARFDEDRHIWLPLETTRDFVSRKVFAYTNHFSRFQLMGSAPALNVVGTKAFPNPMRTHRGHTRMFFSNMSANASIKIFTYPGELVRELTADAQGQAEWDGRNNSREPVASGGYIAVIEGEGTKKVMTVVIER